MRIALLALFGVLLLIAPIYLDGSWLAIGILGMAAAIGAIGLTLLVGTAGQLSLAHAFFIAVGSYGYAFLAGEPKTSGASGLGWPPLAAAITAVVLAALAGLIFSPVAARLRGLYLGVASLALVFVAQHVFRNSGSVTGGTNGRRVQTFSILGFDLNGSAPELNVLGVPFEARERMWYVALLILVLVIIFVSRIVAGRPGRALQLLRDNEVAASAMGIPVQRYKASAFVLSSAIAGLAGVVIALAYQTIVPQYFGLGLSVNYLAMVIIGGLGSVPGAVLGAVFVTALPLVLQRFGTELGLLATAGSGGYDATLLSQLIFGVIIVLVIILQPGGLSAIGNRLAVRQRTPHAHSPELTTKRKQNT